MLTEQEPMMLSDTAGEYLHQLSARAAETLMAKRGELFGIRLACDHGFQDAPSACAHDVVITEHSLTYASSRTAWMRCTCCTISRVNCFRVRVRSRNSWIAGGGTKLDWIRPCANRSASQRLHRHLPRGRSA